MADSLKCPWLAVHVEQARPLLESAQSRLEQNLALARALGAEVIDTADENLARGLLRVARQNNVSQIIIGKPAASAFFEWFRVSKLLRQLMQESGDIDLQIVRAEKTGMIKESRRRHLRAVFKLEVIWSRRACPGTCWADQCGIDAIYWSASAGICVPARGGFTRAVPRAGTDAVHRRR